MEKRNGVDKKKRKNIRKIKIIGKYNVMEIRNGVDMKKKKRKILEK